MIWDKIFRLFLRITIVLAIGWVSESLIFLQRAQAEEAKEEKSAEKGTTQAPTQAQTQELMQLQSDINRLHALMNQKKTNLRKLMEEKRDMERSYDPVVLGKIKAHTDTIEFEYGELKNAEEEFNKAMVRLKFRFPEKASLASSGEKIESLKEFEKQASMDDELDKSLRIIKRQYPRSFEGSKAPTNKEPGQ